VIRPDGLVYIAGENTAPADGLVDHGPFGANNLPRDPANVVELTDSALVARLLETARRSSSWLDTENGAQLVTAQVGPRLPVIARAHAELEPPDSCATDHCPPTGTRLSVD